MAEVAWTEEGPATPPKKKIPTWVWFCGSGCLAMLVLGIIATVFFVGYVKDAIDPEKQWAKIAEVLPYDERPADLEVVMGNQIPGTGMKQFSLRDPERRLSVTLQHHEGADGAQARQQMFGSDTPQFPSNVGVMKFEDMTVGNLDVQGREVRVIRMRMQFPDWMKKMMPQEVSNGFGQMLFADITREGDPGLLLLQLMREGGSDPISDEEVRDLLKPFHVGPNR